MSGIVLAYQNKQLHNNTVSNELYPSHKLKQTILEHHAKPPPHSQLNKVGRELGNYCTILPGDEQAEKCWTAYHFFESKKKALIEGCDINHQTQICQNLDRFEDAMRELSYSGLPTIANFLFNMASREQQQNSAPPHSPSNTKDQDDLKRELELHELFDHVDSNHNGQIDIGEFRAAMQMLGEQLSGRAVATICQAMDVHGYLNFYQFQAIVEAVEVTAHSETAKVLRTICDSDKPDWWTECPESLA